ncbi:paxillin-like [Centruroides sculpturatus]|uniref:paxillin-like n=1 Tax=Centruroides sculpturatus TaxID=218467 RepID=UPI000C6CD40D|nr:paxillin-like [Centruroides sculpturatus]
MWKEAKSDSTSTSFAGVSFVDGMTSSRPYQPFRSYGKNVPPPAYALLADLQKTTSHLNTSPTYKSPSSPDNASYGSLGSPRSPHQFQYNMAYSPAAHATAHSATDRHEYCQGEKNSPIYQNQQVIKEVTTTTTIANNTTAPNSRTHQPCNPNLSSNLSELDTLLEDLNSARFMNYADKKAQNQIHSNGPSTIPQYNERESPQKPSTANSYSMQDGRPSVESLLDELQSAVPKHSSYCCCSNKHLIQKKEHMWQALLFCFTLNKSAAKAHRMLVEAHGNSALSETTCRDWFRQFKDGNFDLSDKKCENQPRKIEDHQLQALLDENDTQSQKMLAEQLGVTQPAISMHLHAMGKIQKIGKWVPYELNDRQMEQCQNTCKILLARQKRMSFLRHIVTGDEKWIYFENPKCKKLWVVTALGKTWHPEHFTCTHCNLELGTKNFFERDGEPYCEKDYHNIFSPRCAYCNGPILDKCVTALDKTWHPEHFFCTQCGRQFGEDGFHEKDGKPYCREDYFDMFAPKCGGCNRPITENYISALNSQWHPECFVCRDCRQPFNGGSFYDHDGQPYCETHYHAKRGSLCAGCHKPITGRCVTAMFRKFHPEHFVCSFCLKQLNKGTFKEQNDKPYCHACFEKLFG